MKSFQEIKENSSTTGFVVLNESDFLFLNESEKEEVQNILAKIGDKKLSELDEGTLSSIFGGVAGFIAGPAIGKIIANALGIEKGILYDMFTSRLVSAALGAALGKRI